MQSSDRAGLIDDAFAFAFAELLPFDQALSMTRFLAEEMAYPVWASAVSHVGTIS